MSGIIGGGGLGKIAINYGYYRYKYLVMFLAVVLLILLKWLVPFDWMTLCSFHLNLSYEFGFLETIAAEYNDVGSLRKEIG